MATGTLHLRHKQTIIGPFTKAQVKVMAHNGKIHHHSEISVDGSPWVPVMQTDLKKYLPVSMVQDLKSASSFLADTAFFKPLKLAKKAPAPLGPRISIPHQPVVPATAPARPPAPPSPPNDIDLMAVQVGKKTVVSKYRQTPKPGLVSMAECFFWLALLLELGSNGWRLMRLRMAGASDFNMVVCLAVLGLCTVAYVFLVANVAAKRNWARFLLLLFVLLQIAWVALSARDNFGAQIGAGMLSLLPAALNVIAIGMLFSGSAEFWFSPQRKSRRNSR